MNSPLAPETNILVAVPTMGSIHPYLVSRLIGWGRSHPKQVSFYFSYKVAPVDRARNEIAEYFMRGEFTHLLMIDSDTVPPHEALDNLIAHGKDVTTGMTPIASYNDEIKDYDVYDNVFKSVDKDENGKIIQTNIPRRNSGLHEIFRCGAACILIKRAVFEKLPRPFFQFVSNADGTKHVRSEDINFCDAVRNAGFSIHADTSVTCAHFKDLVL